MALRHCTNIIMLLVVGRAFANLQQNFDSVLPIMGCIDWPPSQDSQGSRRAWCKMTRFDRRVRQLEAHASTNYKTSGGRCEVWMGSRAIGKNTRYGTTTR